MERSEFLRGVISGVEEIVWDETAGTQNSIGQRAAQVALEWATKAGVEWEAEEDKTDRWDEQELLR